MPNLLKLPDSLKNQYDIDSLVFISNDELAYNSEVDPKIIDAIKSKDLQIFTGWYEYEKGWQSPKIYLIGYSTKYGKLKLKIEGFLPYCYVPDSNGEYISFDGKKLKKLLFKSKPKDVALYRDKCIKLGLPTPYEADIPFVRRYRIDMLDYFKSESEIYPPVAIVDIETNHPESDDIISIAINLNGELYFIHEDNSLLNTLECYSIIKDAVILTGWNFLKYDYKYLTRDLKTINQIIDHIALGNDIGDLSLKLSFNYKLGNPSVINKIINKLIKLNKIKIKNNKIIYKEKLDEKLNEFAVIDLLEISKKMYPHELKSWALHHVARELCDISYPKPSKHPKDLSEEDLLYRNVMDVIIPEEIDNLLGGIQFHVILSWMLQANIEDLIYHGTVNDIIILREYFKNGLVLPSKNYEEEKEGYSAADPDATPGFYENIIALDLTHAYPSILMALNASIETKDPNGELIAANGVRFSRKKSVFVEAVKYLMNKRKEIKELMKKYNPNSDEYKRLDLVQFALKTQAAAYSHGIFGWKYSRLFDEEVADAITSTARDIIETLKEFIESTLKRKVIYTHTDSIYLIGEENEINEIINILNNQIKEYCEERGYLYTPKLELKNFYPKGYIHARARNVLIDEDGNWHITGMNFNRAEVPEYLSELERKLIEMKLNGASNAELKAYLRKEIRNLHKVDSLLLGIKKPLKKPIEKYENNTLHIRALLNAKKDYGFMVEVGESYLILPVKKLKHNGKSDWIAFSLDDGLPSDYEIDVDTYLRSCLYGKIAPIFGMSSNQLEEYLKSGDLFDY